ncbi:MAG: CopG family transcriptional regulator [Brevundimonas sp.]|uniref:CopG family transcriptional regulator n=1 Tax=Brevundimonas sp. TaxID=1871086 RepID=UPI00262DEBE1|nr:CopG family transcriptional regulator [Brevundimonas sp.]MDI6624501.1 CopG family transcriptional regulator [Brevundimonas sp.]MDQ7813125.1 CopG family transcriptional regulator [Brevundimonas sp.]
MSDPGNEFDEEPVVFEEADELDARERKAMADIDAGRFVTHEAVRRWLLSLSTDNPLPRPKCGE